MKPIEQYLKDNYFTAIESLKGGYCLDGKSGNLYTRLLNTMEEMLKDAYNEGIEDAVKNVRMSGYYSDPNKAECFNLKRFKRIWENRLFKVETNIIIDKDSILKLKK
jgi:hypothetical protein